VYGRLSATLQLVRRGDEREKVSSDFHVTERERALLRDLIARRRLEEEREAAHKIHKFGRTPEDRLLTAVLLVGRARSGDDYARVKVRKIFGLDALSPSDKDAEQESPHVDAGDRLSSFGPRAKGKPHRSRTRPIW
jgi:hypothetical protein